MITIIFYIVITAALIGCLAFILQGKKTKYRPLAFVALVAIGITVGYFSMSKHPVYEKSINTIINNQEIRNLIGSPIETGLSIKATYDDTFGCFKFPVHGPKGQGTVSIYAEKVNDLWVYRTFEVNIANKIIDLKAMPNQ